MFPHIESVGGVFDPVVCSAAAKPRQIRTRCKTLFAPSAKRISSGWQANPNVNRARK